MTRNSSSMLKIGTRIRAPEDLYPDEIGTITSVDTLQVRVWWPQSGYYSSYELEDITDYLERKIWVIVTPVNKIWKDLNEQ